ncbi:MAG: sulfite exporter TauE/SafE family protein [Rhodothermales bacterium]|nr:sulfite exporter TauE/SafE family protein [Rhodothermales bacterium]
METFLVLTAAGLAAGFVAGLVGVGGGIIFAPVLLFYFRSLGVAEPALTPLTLGTSLLCTLFTTSVSSFHHHRRGVVVWRIAGVSGIGSVVGVVAIATLVTTQPWYDQGAFRLVFSLLLVVVAIRMIVERERSENADRMTRTDVKMSSAGLAMVGTAAGTVSAAAGVGGGVVLVPAFNRLVKLPIHSAIGTSSATIILIATIGVTTYAIEGIGLDIRSLSLGYVDPLTALGLSVPALFTTRAGVITAHRIRQRPLRIGFAVFALIVAAKLTSDALLASW